MIVTKLSGWSKRSENEPGSRGQFVPDAGPGSATLGSISDIAVLSRHEFCSAYLLFSTKLPVSRTDLLEQKGRIWLLTIILDPDPTNPIVLYPKHNIEASTVFVEARSKSEQQKYFNFNLPLYRM
jgi:hypothetical protein